MLSKLFGAARALRTSGRTYGSIPPGNRVYAIGDVHGRLDLLDALLERITGDAGGAPSSLIFLGDLVDRGPDSAGAVERVRQLAADGQASAVLMGNHEEIFLGALSGDEELLRLFCRVGGRETALSYGVGSDEYDALDYPGLARRLEELVPPAHREFLAGLAPYAVRGDYAFVHAGVRPGTALEEQRPGDLRWIRGSFLEHPGPFGHTVVHGHSVTEEVDFKANRIGIDTGAYASGRLTALGLEGDRYWLLQT